MDKFCIITNLDKDEGQAVTDMVKQYLMLKNKSFVSIMEENLRHVEEKGFIDISYIPQDIDCAIVLGGDGTMIQAANDLFGTGIPILGINLGTLGFLTEVEKQNLYPALDALMEDKYKIESRMMLNGMVSSGSRVLYQGSALNDIVITRSGYSRLISVKIYVNDALMSIYQGDGVIIATPTGTTGYNLSAGGPIATPEVKVMTITPICPHSFNKTSMIVSASDKITVKIGKSKKTQKEEAIVTFDGRRGVELQTEDMIIIEKAGEETKFVKVTGKSFFEIIRNKLGQEKGENEKT